MFLSHAIFLTLLTLVPANPVPQDSSDIDDSVTSQDTITAETDPYSVSGVGCTSDVFTDETSNEEVQKRGVTRGKQGTCPASYPATLNINDGHNPVHSTQNEHGATQDEKSSTGTEKNPCSNEEFRRVHVTCGGPIVHQSRFISVLNCVPGMVLHTP